MINQLVDTPFPEVGDEVYVPSLSYFKGSEEVSFGGGLATVIKTWEVGSDRFIFVKEIEPRNFSWQDLKKVQNTLREEYKGKKAKPLLALDVTKYNVF